MKAALSPPMRHVLDRMKEGWALCLSGSVDGGEWLQQRGCGQGGETERVNAATTLALYRRGLIECKKRDFPTSVWALTPKGRNA